MKMAWLKGFVEQVVSPQKHKIYQVEVLLENGRAGICCKLEWFELLYIMENIVLELMQDLCKIAKTIAMQ